MEKAEEKQRKDDEEEGEMSVEITHQKVSDTRRAHLLLELHCLLLDYRGAA